MLTGKKFTFEGVFFLSTIKVLTIKGDKGMFYRCIIDLKNVVEGILTVLPYILLRDLKIQNYRTFSDTNYQT